MYRVVLKLAFFLSLLYPCGAFSQEPLNANTVVANYNKWLTGLQLNKLVIAEKIIQPDQTDPHYILVLTPAAAYRTPEDMAKAWAYFKDGFEEKKIDLPLLLFNKLGTYSNLPLDKIKLIIKTAQPETFSLEISYDKEIIINEKTGSVRGGDVAVDYNFEAPPLVSMLSRTYTLKSPIPDLKTYTNKWQSFFENSKHRPGDKIQVSTPFFETSVIKLVVGNIFKDVTAEDYYEMIVLQIVTLRPKSRPAQINYSASVYYAAKAGDKAPPPQAFRDIADEPDFNSKLNDYKIKLEKQFQSIFNVDH